MADKLDLAAIKARCEAATPGPWEIYPDGKYFCVTPNVTASSFGGQTAKRDDAEFIAHAREDIPALVAEVERINAQLAMVKKFLKYFGRCSYPDAYVARNILEKLEGEK